MIKRILFFLLCIPAIVSAQINTDRVMLIAQNALYFEDYVLSIQYFNQVINAKPYLYEPYFYRGMAKINLDDYIGAEEDCNEAIKRNPFVVGAYQIRGLARIKQGKFDGAIEDYQVALKYDPENVVLWHNLTLCHLQKGEYQAANQDLEKLLVVSPKYAQAYVMKGDIALRQKDTLQALNNYGKAIELDRYNADVWMVRGNIRLSQNKFKEAEGDLSEAIKINGKEANNYINRALARFHQNNLRGAMNDYNLALDIDPENFIGHYNRGLLRAQVGDDNRAIQDFNFVIKADPTDMIATYNRALLRAQTGDYRGAIRDYTTVLRRYPNSLMVYSQRAAARRKIGDKNGAELDEFKILKMEMGQGVTKNVKVASNRTRRRSDKDIDNYQKIVIADEDDNATQQYNNDYRGKVQNRTVTIKLQPMFVLSYYEKLSDVNNSINYYKYIDQLNHTQYFPAKLLLTCNETALSEEQAKFHFKEIDEHSLDITKDEHNATKRFVRGMDFYLVQDFASAKTDFTQAITEDNKFFPAYMMRAIVEYKELEYKKSERDAETASKDKGMTKKEAAFDYDMVKSDLGRVIELAPDFVYGYYDLATLQSNIQDYRSAIENYTKAIKLKGNFAEAYYNRGLTNIYLGNNKQGIADLSKAGELGIISAYNVIKRFINKK
jgi:tetratricopeptide (TPR) repeat protein